MNKNKMRLIKNYWFLRCYASSLLSSSHTSPLTLSLSRRIFFPVCNSVFTHSWASWMFLSDEFSEMLFHSTVKTFSITARGGNGLSMPSRVLSRATDTVVPRSTRPSSPRFEQIKYQKRFNSIEFTSRTSPRNCLKRFLLDIGLVRSGLIFCASIPPPSSKRAERIFTLKGKPSRARAHSFLHTRLWAMNFIVQIKAHKLMPFTMLLKRCPSWMESEKKCFQIPHPSSSPAQPSPATANTKKLWIEWKIWLLCVMGKNKINEVGSESRPAGADSFFSGTEIEWAGAVRRLWRFIKNDAGAKPELISNDSSFLVCIIQTRRGFGGQPSEAEGPLISVVTLIDGDWVAFTVCLLMRSEFWCRHRSEPSI